MKQVRIKTLLLLQLAILSVVTTACERIKANLPAETTSTTSSSTTTYTCSTFFNGAKYDSLLSCQTSTGAQCLSSLESFSNGATATCYTPMATDCWADPNNLPSWEYTAYTVTALSPGGYVLQNSLLGCSRSECNCNLDPNTLLPVDPIPNMTMTIAYGVYVPFISGLPSPCTIASCGPYIYQGSLGMQQMNFQLAISPVIPGPSLISTDTTADITLMSGPANQNLKLYANSSCMGTPLNGSSGTNLDGSGYGSASGLSVTGGGMKTFYAIISDGTVSGTTQCSNTGLSFYQIVNPVLNLPQPVIVPSAAVQAGQQIFLSFSNMDTTAMNYTCTVDTVMNGVSDSMTSCTSIPGSSFSATTGIFTWTPSASQTGYYEICATGSNNAGSDSECSQIYFVNNALYGMNLATSTSVLIGSTWQTVSGDANPVVTVSNAPPGLTFHVYTDSSCSNEYGGSTVLTGGTPNGSILGNLTMGGITRFYAKYEKALPGFSTIESRCIDTNQFFYRLGDLELNNPSDMIFPSSPLKTMNQASLSFQANDPTLVTYNCKFNQDLNQSALFTGSNCSTLPGGSTFIDGVLTWTPPLSAYGPYQICVEGTQGFTSETDSECAVISVIPNTLVTTNLARYFDAQFASEFGGNQASTSPVWVDLSGYSDGEAKNIVFTSSSGWSGNGSTASPYALTINTGSGTQPTGNSNLPFVAGLHEDYVDLGSISNAGQSVTMDFWIKPTQQPTTSTWWVFNALNGITWMCGSTMTGCWNQSVLSWACYSNATGCPGPWCSGTGCTNAYPNGASGWNKYPVNVNEGYIYSYYDPASTVDGRVGMSSYVRHLSATQFHVVFDIQNSAGSYSAWCASNALNYGQWYHITEIWNHNSMSKSIYVNGVLSGCNNVPVTIPAPLPVVNRKLILGAFDPIQGPEFNSRMNGSIANFRMYNGANSSIPNTNWNAEKQRFGY